MSYQLQELTASIPNATGCTLSSAIASFLSLHGLTLNESVIRAKEYINQAIANGASYQIGQGQRPGISFLQILGIKTSSILFDCRMRGRSKVISNR
ncbi:MAG: bifunctional hydroxymethylpyrimidine kinase/phosphomethylpyrimidine kinase [Bacteroides graminisolvens]